MAQIIGHDLSVSVGVLVEVGSKGMTETVKPAMWDTCLGQQGVETPAEGGVVQRLAIGVGDITVVALRLLGLQPFQIFQGGQAQIQHSRRRFRLRLALHVGHAAHCVALCVTGAGGGKVSADLHAAGLEIDVAVFQGPGLPGPQAGVQQEQKIFRLFQLLRRRLDGISFFGFPAQHVAVLYHVPDAGDLLRRQNVDRGFPSFAPSDANMMYIL